MFDAQKVLKAFPSWRERKLRQKKRFKAFDVFYYRSSLWLHHLRVAALVQELFGTITELLPRCDVGRAWVTALFHDDCEIVTDDIPLFYKEAMNAEEKKELKETEVCVAQGFAKVFPRAVNGHNYYQLLLGAIYKDSLEARVVSYCDKLDAYCESLHELFAGNFSAYYPVSDYPLRIEKLRHEYRDLTPLFERQDIPLLNIHLRADPRQIRHQRYVHFGQPHTPESVLLATDLPFYDHWRSIVRHRLGEEGLQWLITKTEPVAVAELPNAVIMPQPLKLALVS